LVGKLESLGDCWLEDPVEDLRTTVAENNGVIGTFGATALFRDDVGRLESLVGLGRSFRSTKFAGFVAALLP